MVIDRMHVSILRFTMRIDNTNHIMPFDISNDSYLYENTIHHSKQRKADQNVN